MIVFDCPGCGKSFQVKDEFAGRETKCPKCRAVLFVPALAVPIAARSRPVAEAAPTSAVMPQTPVDEMASPDEAHSELPILVSSYIRQNLMPGEHLVGITRIHPLVLVAPSIVAAVGLVLALVGIVTYPCGIFFLILGIAKALVAGIILIVLYVECLTTEFSCTDRRILIKSGLITTRLREMPLAKVEALLMEQDFLGKIFGYGTLVFKGSGGTRRICKSIEAPFDFYKRVQEQVAVAQQRR